ncbi:alanine--tRNA ligase-related protein [Actinomadura sp. 9N407]|uniref:alanine--tRNA ligase-related protein n=1 Tax=Actinomadura sp. 9N407 TaxID=3375154 RepID=UPI0037A87C7A
MRSTDIRTTFLDFFSARGHRVVPSSPLVPSDPTLLLTGAGMDQFKPYFLGQSVPGYRRATSVQKCARTSDIDNVGRTTRHSTFFEMLGGFSFGDYFKEEAIGWAWELLTEGFGLDPERLWATVYLDDEEAERHWRRIGVPASRIQRLGMADNYWSMGVPGPCGPSSELHYDRGPAFGPEGGPAVNGERYLEIWNLVFMQNVRGEGPAKEGYPIVGELPARSIDTGLGLDRLAAILQGVDTLCETDLVGPALRLVQELAGRAYPGRDGSEASTSFRVAAEHARSAAFLIADGVLPSPDGRGYVLRRLMRRAVRHARVLGVEGPALSALTARVVDTLGGTWPELDRHRELIRQVTAARAARAGSRTRAAAVPNGWNRRSPKRPVPRATCLLDFPAYRPEYRAKGAGVLRVFCFGSIGVTVEDVFLVDPDPVRGGRERGVRIELRLLAPEPWRGSNSASQKIVADQAVFRIDLLETAAGGPGTKDRMHFHPGMRDNEPGTRTFVDELTRDPIGWVEDQLSEPLALLESAGIAPEAHRASADDLRAGLAEVVGTVSTVLDEVRAGNLATTPVKPGPS